MDTLDHWQTLVTGILALVGAIATVWALRHEGQRAERRTASVARMQIASQIRTWLLETADVFDTSPIFDQLDHNPDPNRYVFPATGDIPVFPFQNSLDTISMLPGPEARSVFDLIERRANAEREADFNILVADNEQVAEAFEPKVARLFLDCVVMYREFGRSVGWTAPPVSDRVIAEMQQRIAKAEERLKREMETPASDLLE